MINRVAAIIVLTGYVVFRAPVWSLTLSEAVQHTLNTNPDVLQASNNRLAVGEELEQATFRP